jgi:hypothetical protein
MQTKKMEALDGWYKVAQEAFRRKDKGTYEISATFILEGRGSFI